jgi:hypothetical protein
MDWTNTRNSFTEESLPLRPKVWNAYLLKIEDVIKGDRLKMAEVRLVSRNS